MQKKPNIIFIQNDHQAYYRWGWDGGSKPLRPNFDQLAQSGAVFNNAYCVSPLCGPARRSMLMGLYPHTHRRTHNYTDSPYNYEVYLNTLAEAGYQNYYYGKWHAGPGSANNHNCQGFSQTNYGNPYLSEEYAEYLKRYNLPKAVHHIKRVFEIPNYKRQGDFLKLEAGVDYSCESSWCGEHAIGVTTTPKETHESFFLATLACEQLEKLAQEKSDQPFSLRVDFWGPHQPHFPAQEFLDLYKDLDLPEYPSLNSKLQGKPAFYHTERNLPLGKDGKIIWPSTLSWTEWLEVVRHCYAHISMVDAAGGLILAKLEELDLLENTLIIWTTDHGDGLASQGGHFDKGSYMSEEVMRIPLAMSWKGKIAPGQILDEYVSTVDYPVTILDAAGTRFTKNEVHGRSLLPLVKGEEVDWREDLLAETYGHGYGEYLVSRMIVHGDYKYIATRDFTHELYDLKQDPYELQNLINDPNYQSVLADMRKRLVRWQLETDDPERVV